MEIKLYKHQGNKYGHDYKYILAKSNGFGFIFRRKGKIQYGRFTGIDYIYLASDIFVIDIESKFSKHIFKNNNNEIYLKCSNYPDTIYRNIKTFEEYDGDIADLKPFNKKLTLKNK